MGEIPVHNILRHYKRKDIQEAIVENAKDREVSVRFSDMGFGKRPDVLQYPEDVFASVTQFVDKRRYGSSFHASEERWHNPLVLLPGMKRNELNENRKGWDFVIDIDCHFLEYSKIAADLVVKFLKYSGISNISAKFSGRAGFHIGVCWESFPQKIAGKETKDMFPEAPRKIALYMKERIKEDLSRAILEHEGSDFAKIQEKTGKQAQEITRETVKDGVRVKKLDVEPFLDIDTLLISSRHLYRMPYTFNEKSGWVSVPVPVNKILEFDVKDALPDNVSVNNELKFLDRQKANPGEAAKLLIEALDFKAKDEIKKQSELDESKEVDVPEQAIPEECFPPCIQNTLKGLKDGRKRAMFALVNFFTSVGWSAEQTQQRMLQWNKLNEEPLREQDIINQVNYHKQKKQLVLPPNCDNKNYYTDFQVCKPDNLCARVRNPVSYAKRRLFAKKKKK
jgi:hypothetical protein